MRFECLLAVLLGVAWTCVSAENVPAMIYLKNGKLGDNIITVGHSMKSSEFIDYLKKIQSKVDVILLDKLNDEDSRKFVKQSEFSSNNFHYQPAVESPYETIESFLKNSKITLNLERVNDDVDKAHSEFLNRVSDSGSEVVILTGRGLRTLQLSRDKRLAEEPTAPSSTNPTNSSETFVFGYECAAMFESIYIVDQSAGIQAVNTSFLTMSGAAYDCSNETSTLSISFFPNVTIFNAPITHLSLILSYRSSSGYYLLNSNSTLNTTEQSFGLQYMGDTHGMETPDGFSFTCTLTYFQLYNMTDSTPLVKVAFYIENLQIQPSGMQVNGTNYTFGPVNYCEGFFTMGIWMGISTTVILTTILMFGVCFLMSIKTMDRFDDPKGKPLNIPIEK